MSLRPTLPSSMNRTLAVTPAGKPPQRALQRRTAAVAAARDAAPSLASAAPKLLPKALEAAFSRNPKVGADLIGAAVWEGQSIHALAQRLTPDQRAVFASELARQKFAGKRGEKALVPLTHHSRLLNVLLVGLGAPDPVACFDAGKSVARYSAQQRAQHTVMVPPEPRGEPGENDEALTQLVRGLRLGSYRFDACKSQPAPATPYRLDVAHGRGGRWNEAAARGIAMAEAAALARDLVNTPANMLTPSVFADIAATRAERHGLTCRIYDEQELRAHGMTLMNAVGQGSENPPRLVHLRYRPEGAPDTPPDVALVGKGITFDSGGLCIKAASGMLGMKADMGGAAAVLGAIVGAADMRAPIAVDAVLALAENSIGEGAYRPGDVYKSASGKTVEIINTDAEGRLVLADAIHFARTQGTPEIIDVATLTGACLVALGKGTAALFANNPKLTQDLQQAASKVDESIWHMPLCASLKPELQSSIADLKNLGGGYGGAITAALFLQEFVGDTRWAHLDIAGPATNEEGATGFAAATLAQYLCSHSSAQILQFQI